ncbi:class I SAM-dependent rRNA methyltransferase [Sulfuriroseicoccus oceanibius]|uniref:Class I SAM-dependent rRNA methyltransferase n=1 Tax=Sulfuriroseicoccus oceanibius TaxID=2707525 RepID=A0A6B3LEJ2_9BACT|nr:class I SAM-dependent rRNA methyltransferase [Sulfuriroseicoccus oceanibius]QQL46241.1 class I SAM-dependent rRNA methyltransferase [Sulfuriroseicoccus oceanibius]
MASLFIKSRSRIFHGHDWVMAYEVDHASGDPNPGDVVMLKDLKNRVLGSGIYNPNSLIIARRISRRKQKLNEDFFRRRIERAIDHRTSSPIDPRYCRLVWSESDGLPGLIVDRYGDHLVVQTTTLAMDQHLDIITKVLVELVEPQSIIERNDAPIRRAEGLEERNGVLFGTDPGEVTIEINGITFTTHLLGGQKTGFYLDQIDSYAAVAKLAEGKRVLDCFTNQGGFALACANAGATSVKAIDISEPDIERAKKNAEANGLSEQIEWVAGNVFNYLKAATKDIDDDGNPTEQYDMIILDPPSFTKNRKTLPNAMRGYKEIHLRALKLLAPGGLLVTYSCSHHVSRSEYLEMINGAAVDAKRNLRLLESHGQRPDHPIILGIPETEYLKGFVLEAIASW